MELSNERLRVVGPSFSKTLPTKEYSVAYDAGMNTCSTNLHIKVSAARVEEQKPMEWGSKAFVSQLNEQKRRLVTPKPNPKSFSRSESLPTRLSPFIERRTVSELAELLEGKIPFPVFNDDGTKHANPCDESSLSLAEQLSRQMDRLNAVYTPKTKQKMFFQRSASMPCTSPKKFVAEAPSSPKRSVSELSEVLRLKIPELAETKVASGQVGVLAKSKKIHSRNAASSTTTFVATKIDRYVDTATRRRLFERAESMPLNQTVRQLADQLKHKIPMVAPLVSTAIKKDFHRSHSTPQELDLFVGTEKRVESQSVRDPASHLRNKVSSVGTRIESSVGDSGGGGINKMLQLKKSKSVAELSVLLKDKLHFSSRTRDDKIDEVCPSNLTLPDYAIGKSRLRAAEFANQIPKGSVLSVASALGNKLCFRKHIAADVDNGQSTELRTGYLPPTVEAYPDIRPGSVRAIASDLKHKLVFRLQKEFVEDQNSGQGKQSSKLHEVSVIRAEEAASLITEGLVRTVAFDMKSKLKFRIPRGASHDADDSCIKNRLSPGPSVDQRSPTRRTSEANVQIRKGLVLAVASSLQGKLHFRHHTSDKNNDPLLGPEEASAVDAMAFQLVRHRASEASRQVAKGSVKAVAADLREKLSFRIHNEQSKGKHVQCFLPEGSVGRGKQFDVSQQSRLRAAEAEKEVKTGSVIAVAAHLKEKLFFRLYAKQSEPLQQEREVGSLNKTAKTLEGPPLHKTKQIKLREQVVESRVECHSVERIASSLEAQLSHKFRSTKLMESSTAHEEKRSSSKMNLSVPNAHKEQVDFPPVRDHVHSHTNLSQNVCIRCKMAVDIAGEAATGKRRPRRVDASTQTDVTTALPTPAMDPATQRKSILQWRKRLAARSVIKRPMNNAIAPISFSSYGKESNAFAKKVPRRRWIVPPVTKLRAQTPFSSIRQLPLHPVAIGKAQRNDVSKCVATDSKGASAVNHAFEKLLPTCLGTTTSGKVFEQIVKSDDGPIAPSSSMDSRSSQKIDKDDSPAELVLQDPLSHPRESVTVSHETTFAGEDVVKAADEVSEVTATNETTSRDGGNASQTPPEKTETSARHDFEATQEPLASDGSVDDPAVTEEDKQQPTEVSPFGAESALPRSDTSRKMNVEVHDSSQTPKRNRPPLSVANRRRPIIDPIEKALCEVLVGQSYRESFRESSAKTTVPVQDPMDSAISQALSECSFSSGDRSRSRRVHNDVAKRVVVG